MHADRAKPVDSITRDVVGLTKDEAEKVVMDTWDQAAGTRAPEFKVIVGAGKHGVGLRRRIIRRIEEK